MKHTLVTADEIKSELKTWKARRAFKKLSKLGIAWMEVEAERELSFHPSLQICDGPRHSANAFGWGRTADQSILETFSIVAQEGRIVAAINQGNDRKHPQFVCKKAWRFNPLEKFFPTPLIFSPVN